jgi:hypothetical protein
MIVYHAIVVKVNVLPIVLQTSAVVLLAIKNVRIVLEQRTLVLNVLPIKTEKFLLFLLVTAMMGFMRILEQIKVLAVSVNRNVQNV